MVHGWNEDVQIIGLTVEKYKPSEAYTVLD